MTAIVLDQNATGVTRVLLGSDGRVTLQYLTIAQEVALSEAAAQALHLALTCDEHCPQAVVTIGQEVAHALALYIAAHSNGEKRQ